MDVPGLQIDRRFRDFNFSEVLDPALRSGPDEAALIQMVHAARNGDITARFELADTMRWTLRKATFEAFQRAYGPRPISYEEWFFAKLSQLFGILLCEQVSVAETFEPVWPMSEEPWKKGMTILAPVGPNVDDKEIQAAISPASVDERAWGDLVDKVCQADLAERLAIARRWLRQAGQRTRTAKGKRDSVIREMRLRDCADEEICAELDRQEFPVLPSLREQRVATWVDGWQVKDLRQKIRQVFSKAQPVRKFVKR